MRSLVWCAAAVTAGVLASMAGLGASTNDVPFTKAQAIAGARKYAENCSRCHGVDLEGINGPALKGPSMHGSQTIGDIYGFVSVQMPAGAPGSLSSKTYVEIMAFLLKENGHHAGSEPLTPHVAKRIATKI